MAAAPHDSLSTSNAHAPDVAQLRQDRRDFLTTLTICFGAAGAAGAAWPFLSSLAPTASMQAQKTTTVDLSQIPVGTTKTIMWQGKPVFVRHRTPAEIAAATAADGGDLKDPQTDAIRAQKPEWLVMLAVCTHLGCVPIPGGEYSGWLCPCHGSQFDSAGRIRKGPAPTNLEVPPYTFVDANTLKIG